MINKCFQAGCAFPNFVDFACLEKVYLTYARRWFAYSKAKKVLLLSGQEFVSWIIWGANSWRAEGLIFARSINRRACLKFCWLLISRQSSGRQSRARLDRIRFISYCIHRLLLVLASCGNYWNPLFGSNSVSIFDRRRRCALAGIASALCRAANAHFFTALLQFLRAYSLGTFWNLYHLNRNNWGLAFIRRFWVCNFWTNCDFFAFMLTSMALPHRATRPIRQTALSLSLLWLLFARERVRPLRAVFQFVWIVVWLSD